MKEICLFPKGAVNIPSSKSVAHRSIICACLAEGESIIENISPSLDTQATVRCMEALGAKCRLDDGVLYVNGGLKQGGGFLDCGESGSTLRFLIPIAALYPEKTHFTGHGRLLSRPLDPYFKTLEKNGAKLSLYGDILSVEGVIKPGIYEIPGDISSQFVSGLLFTLPLLEGDSEIHITTPLESASYVDLTLETINAFGVKISYENNRSIYIKGGQKYKPSKYFVEADYSQAAFFLVAAALGCDCECLGLSPVSKQGDRKFLDILKNCGAAVQKGPNGGLTVLADKLHASDVDVTDIPDLVPPLAVLLSFCDGISRITGAGRLRLKESDRLNSVSSSLNALGANIVQDGDSLIINPVSSLKGGITNSFNDHRIAMSAAVAAIKSENPVFLEGSGCVMKSYPDFWHDFEKQTIKRGD